MSKFVIFCFKVSVNADDCVTYPVDSKKFSFVLKPFTGTPAALVEPILIVLQINSIKPVLPLLSIIMLFPPVLPFIYKCESAEFIAPISPAITSLSPPVSPPLYNEIPFEYVTILFCPKKEYPDLEPA